MQPVCLILKEKNKHICHGHRHHELPWSIQLGIKLHLYTVPPITETHLEMKLTSLKERYTYIGITSPLWIHDDFLLAWLEMKCAPLLKEPLPCSEEMNCGTLDYIIDSWTNFQMLYGTFLEHFIPNMKHYFLNMPVALQPYIFMIYSLQIVMCSDEVVLPFKVLKLRVIFKPRQAQCLGQDWSPSWRKPIRSIRGSWGQLGIKIC